jgi:ArsR family transcriptional regulator, arsenate/arsenite/antimonite-responsive transcriptional repressor
MKTKEAIDALGALASEARLTVYRLLVKRGPEGYIPSELAERLGMPAPTLSFHLKGLVQSKLVTSRRDGRNLYYSPDFGRMNGLIAFLTDNCCSLSESACDDACHPAPRVAQSKRKPA